MKKGSNKACKTLHGLIVVLLHEKYVLFEKPTTFQVFDDLNNNSGFINLTDHTSDGG